MRSRLLEALVCISLTVIILSCLGFMAPLQLLVMMVVGWVIFLWRVAPRRRRRPP